MKGAVVSWGVQELLETEFDTMLSTSQAHISKVLHELTNADDRSELLTVMMRSFSWQPMPANRGTLLK